MNKTFIIILLSIIILIGGYAWYNSSVEKFDNSGELIKENADLKRRFDAKQASYDSTSLHVDKLRVELSKAKAEVRRSEAELTKTQIKYERVKIEIKRLIDGYSNDQLDSAFLAMYPRPDSIRH